MHLSLPHVSFDSISYNLTSNSNTCDIILNILLHQQLLLSCNPSIHPSLPSIYQRCVLLSCLPWPSKFQSGQLDHLTCWSTGMKTSAKWPSSLAAHLDLARTLSLVASDATWQTFPGNVINYGPARERRPSAISRSTRLSQVSRPCRGRQLNRPQPIQAEAWWACKFYHSQSCLNRSLNGQYWQRQRDALWGDDVPYPSLLPVSPPDSRRYEYVH